MPKEKKPKKEKKAKAETKPKKGKAEKEKPAKGKKVKEKTPAKPKAKKSKEKVAPKPVKGDVMGKKLGGIDWAAIDRQNKLDRKKAAKVMKADPEQVRITNYIENYKHV